MATRKFSITKADVDNAIASRKDRPASPFAIAHASYSSALRSVVITLSNNTTFSIPVALIEDLSSARPAELKEVRLSPAGDVLIFDRANAHISVQGLIRDFMFGALPPNLLATHFAAKGGAKSSDLKKATSAENGRKGGRPRKTISLDHAHAREAQVKQNSNW